MAYRRSYKRRNYKRRTYKRRTYRKKEPTTLSAVSNVAKNGFFLAKKLARWINVEFKYHNNTLTPYSVANTGHRFYLFSDNATTMGGTPLAIGTDEFSRNGVSVKLQNMQMMYQLYIPSTATVDHATVRIIIVKHKNANGGSFVIGDLLQTTEPLALRNLDNRYHFNTIYDKTHTLTKGDPRGSVIVKQLFKLYGHLHFQNGTNKVENDSYAVVLVSDQSVAGNQPVLTMKFRTSFTDN